MIERNPISDGLALVHDFIQASAFIHDDWTDHEGVGGWGQYSTNPLLFSPPVSVTAPLDGYGERTIEFLRTLGAFGGQIIHPRWATNDLTRNLRADETAMAALKDAVRTKRLNISSFYNDPGRGIEEIAAELSGRDDAGRSHTVRAYPPRDAFLHANDKLTIKEFTRGVPTPEGVNCETLEDLYAFGYDESRLFPGIVVKTDHRAIFYVDSPEGISALAPRLTFPLRAETCYPVMASPIINAIRWQGQTAPLFAVDQYILDWHHWGNGSPAAGTPAQRQAMIDYTMQIGDQMGAYEGVFGVDFILTPDEGVYAVDVNARFCSSTYPYLLLANNGIDADESCTRYRLVSCRLNSLDDIVEDSEFVALDAEAGLGVFMYDPVIYTELPPPQVHYFSYVCVAPTVDACTALDERMTRIIERQSARRQGKR